MSLIRKLSAGGCLCLAALLAFARHARADDTPSRSEKAIAYAKQELANGPWDILDDPFGRAPNGVSLCAPFAFEPVDRDLTSAFANQYVQSLIKSRQLVALDTPSLARLSDAGLDRLKEVPGLTGLRLNADSTKTSNPGFSRLKQMRWLESLEIVGDELTDNDLESVKALTRLRVLNLGTAVKLTGVGLSHLKDLRQLESLELNASALNDDGLENLKQWPKLSGLTLGEPWDARESIFFNHSMGFLPPSWPFVQKGPTPNIDRGMRNLEHLPNLRRLELNGVNITDAGFKPVLTLLRLETLRLSGLKMGEAGFSNLEALKKLRSLEIRDMKTPASALAHLKALLQLEELKLSLTNAGAAQLAGLKSMKRLCIMRHGWSSPDQRDSLSDGAILAAALKTMPKLVDFEITDYVDVGDNLLPGVAGHKDLKRLRLVGVSITDEGLQQLALLTDLEELDIAPVREHFFDPTTKISSDPSPIGDKGMKYLRGLTKLRRLNLEDTDVTDKGLAELAGLVELRQLYLPCGVTDVGIEHLGNLRKLEEIRIPCDNMTAKGVVFLHDHCPNLKTADFEGKNRIEDGELQLDEYAENQYWETHSLIYADVVGTTESRGQTPQCSFDLRPRATLSGDFDVDETPKVSATIALKDLGPNFKPPSIGPKALVVLVRTGDSYSIAPGQPAFMPGDHAPICTVKDFDDPKVRETRHVVQKLRHAPDEAVGDTAVKP